MRHESTVRKRSGASAGRGLLRRAVWVLARLRSGAPIKATLLAREFEVSLRTVYRDLDFLRDEWRVPIEFDRGRGTFYLTEPTALVTPITLSRGEIVALFFAEKVLRDRGGRAARGRRHPVHAPAGAMDTRA